MITARDAAALVEHADRLKEAATRLMHRLSHAPVIGAPAGVGAKDPAVEEILEIARTLTGALTHTVQAAAKPGEPESPDTYNPAPKGAT